MTKTTLNPDLEIKPIGHPLAGSVRVPGSKSLTNRALMLAAMADGVTTIQNALFSDDSLYFVQALQSLGFDVSLDSENSTMTITGLGGEIPVRKSKLFIGNAGTAARFLTAFLTLGQGEFSLDGDTRMRQRPIGDLVTAFSNLGVEIKAERDTHGGIFPPLQIMAGGLAGGRTDIAGNVSSQYISALLMVAPYAKGPVLINLTSELNSKPYVEMTLDVMADFGVEVERDGYRCFRIQPARFSSVSEYLVESDASSASYFFAAPAVCGGTVTVRNINRISRQGDIKFLGVLEKMGCVVRVNDSHISVSAPSELHGVDVDMRDISDTALTLAAVAPFASSMTRIRGIASSRVKETDRVSAACTELRKVGVEVDEHEDGMTIYPCEKLTPAVIHTYNDHRIAMAFSLIGLRIPGIKIENPGCVSKTFPNYFDVLEGLR